MTEKPNKVNITLNPDGVFAPLLNILGQSSKNVLFGLQLIDSVDDIKEPLEIESEDTFFTFHFSDPNAKQDIAVSKDNFKLWTFQKGFEDLIKGINLTLIEAYFFVTIITRRNDLKTFGDLQNEIIQMRKTALEQSLPGLLSKVKPCLTGNLTYEKQVTSLNKVRNCLVHRNGIVTPKDINDKTTNQLRAEYSRMKMYADKDGQETEVKKFTMVEGGSSIKMKIVNESIDFNLGNRVQFDYQQFNSLLTTCYLFGLDLAQKLPKIETETYNEENKK